MDDPRAIENNVVSDAVDIRHHELPPELQVAPRDFNAWSQAQLLQEQAASTPDAPLYHYTGEEALKGILANEKIWCFDHRYQKDRKEFDYSLTIARRVIEELGGSDDGPTGHFCACLIDLWTTIPSLTRLSSIFSALAAMKTIRSNGRSMGTAVVVSRSGLRPLYSLQPRRH